MDTATIVTAVATFVTSVISLIIILEMKKQRKESHKPVVVPVCSFYSLKSYEDGRFSLFTQEGGEYTLNLFIYLANAGTGTALNLRIGWSFDFQRFLKENDFKSVRLNYDGKMLSVQGRNFNQTHYLQNQKEESVSLLLTAENESEKLLLPQYMATILKITRDERRFGTALLIPELILQIEFEDVGLKTYREKFFITFGDKFDLPILDEPKLEYNEIGRFHMTKKA